jgi:hypothetical protein
VLLTAVLNASEAVPKSQTHPALAVEEQFLAIKKRNFVSPYITSIFALDILRNGGDIDKVRDFILWYAQRANRLDRFGVSGTVYDRIIYSSGKERSLNRYDSADGYAGMYLYLVAEYYRKTGDKSIVRKVWSVLRDNVYLILYLQDKDGLTKALAGSYRTKYLMDNVESCIGAASYVYLAREIGVDIGYYSGLKESLKNAIMTQLYDEKKKIFYWEKEGRWRNPARVYRYYPDTFAKIHLLAFCGRELRRDIARKLWYDIRRLYRSRKPRMGMEQMIIYNWAKSFALKNRL